MVWSALIGLGSTIWGASQARKQQKSAQRAQQQGIDNQLAVARETNATQRAIAQAQMANANRILGAQLAYNYPRQHASNSALGQASAMMGLGDIFAAPVENGMGGGPQYYPGAPGGTPLPPAPTIGGGVGADPRSMWASYVNNHDDLLAEYNAFASRPGGYAFGPNLPRSWDRDGDNYIDIDEYGEFHWNKWGKNESNRTDPTEGGFY